MRMPLLMQGDARRVELKKIGEDVDFRNRAIQILGREYFSTQDAVLILSRIHDPEADIVGRRLLAAGVNYVRLNADYLADEHGLTLELTPEGVHFSTTAFGCDLHASDIRLVWLRHFDVEAVPRPPGTAAGSYVTSEWREFLRLLEHHLPCRWTNPPSALRQLDKLRQLQLARTLGFLVPPTVVTNDPRQITAFYARHDGNIICKSLHHHYVEHEASVLTEVFGRRLSPQDLSTLPMATGAPLICQAFVPHQVEVRVTVIGQEVFAAEITNKAEFDDWHRMGSTHVHTGPHQLPTPVAQQCAQLVRQAGLDYGALDLLLAETGNYTFLEINPIGDWNWVQLSSGLPLADAVVQQLLTLGGHHEYARR